MQEEQVKETCVPKALDPDAVLKAVRCPMSVGYSVATVVERLRAEMGEVSGDVVQALLIELGAEGRVSINILHPAGRFDSPTQILYFAAPVAPALEDVLEILERDGTGCGYPVEVIVAKLGDELGDISEKDVRSYLMVLVDEKKAKKTIVFGKNGHPKLGFAALPSTQAEKETRLLGVEIWKQRLMKILFDNDQPWISTMDIFEFFRSQYPDSMYTAEMASCLLFELLEEGRVFRSLGAVPVSGDEVVFWRHPQHVVKAAPANITRIPVAEEPESETNDRPQRGIVIGEKLPTWMVMRHKRILENSMPIPECHTLVLFEVDTGDESSLQPISVPQQLRSVTDIYRIAGPSDNLVHNKILETLIELADEQKKLEKGDVVWIYSDHPYAGVMCRMLEKRGINASIRE